MLWKLYFWISAAITILALIVSALYSGKLTPTYNIFDWVGLFLSIPSLVGLFVFVYKKPISTATVWKAIFWFSIFLDAYYLTPIKDLAPTFLRPSATSPNLVEALVVIVLDAPLLYALFQLSFNPQWNLEKKHVQKRQVSMVSTEKTFWWQVSSIVLVLYGFVYLFGLITDTRSLANFPTEVKIATAVIGFVQIIIGVLLWFRVNLALILAIIYFTIRAIGLLIVGHYGEFILNTIVFMVLFILILISQVRIHSTRDLHGSNPDRNRKNAKD